jgi:hypothetical protein
MTITENPRTAPTACPAWARSRSLRLVAPVAWAVAGTLLLWSVAEATGVDLVVGTGAGATTVGPVAVVLVSATAALAGSGLLALLERRRNGRVWFTAIATAILLLSFAGPLGAVGNDAVTVLLNMHVVVWLALVVTAWRRC